MLITGRSEVCKEFADALGLKNCTGLSIEMKVNDVVRVNASFVLEDRDLEKLIQIVKKYHLVAVEDTGVEV